MNTIVTGTTRTAADVRATLRASMTEQDRSDARAWRANGAALRAVLRAKVAAGEARAYRITDGREVHLLDAEDANGLRAGWTLYGYTALDGGPSAELACRLGL